MAATSSSTKNTQAKTPNTQTTTSAKKTASARKTTAAKKTTATKKTTAAKKTTVTKKTTAAKKTPAKKRAITAKTLNVPKEMLKEAMAASKKKSSTRKKSTARKIAATTAAVTTTATRAKTAGVHSEFVETFEAVADKLSSSATPKTSNNGQNLLPTERIRLRLREVRKQLGMSTDVMAVALGVPKRVYISWEYGERHPKLDMLYAFANTLNVDPAWLSGLSELPGPSLVSGASESSQPQPTLQSQLSIQTVAPKPEWLGLPEDQALHWQCLEDDSYLPHIAKGGWLWIDQTQPFEQPGYYALSLSGKVTVRHISESLTGGYVLSSSNPVIQSVEVSDLSLISVLGPVRAYLAPVR